MRIPQVTLENLKGTFGILKDIVQNLKKIRLSLKAMMKHLKEIFHDASVIGRDSFPLEIKSNLKEILQNHKGSSF